MENTERPLADLLRPNNLNEYIGQKHLVGEGGPIWEALKNGQLFSMIFWGTPGCGKTTLARLIANEIKADFIEISPVTSGIKDIKELVEKLSTKNAKQGDLFSTSSSKQLGKTILFVDEIHRFNKAQQDYLLPHVENGLITLIGATTENPSFEVISPLLSRTKVFVLNPLSKTEMNEVFDRAILKVSTLKLEVQDNVRDFLLEMSNGDARNLINSIDVLYKTKKLESDLDSVKKVLQLNLNRYDKNGEEHYNTISAYIKSMRAGKIDAALYYLARMVNAGEDPKFIARRLFIFASEDVGIADRGAIEVAAATFKSCEVNGYPECQISLAHATVYMCQAPKSRASYNAYFKALDDVKSTGNLDIPLNLRNAPTKLMKDLGYSSGYEMYPEEGSYLPERLKARKYYEETHNK